MQRIRVRLSSAQRADLWRRWKAGQSLHEIGRAFGKSHVVIHFLLARHGGIAPAARRRSLRTLTLAEREDISRGIAGGSSIRQIAKGLQRAVSTVSREVARHGGRPQVFATYRNSCKALRALSYRATIAIHAQPDSQAFCKAHSDRKPLLKKFKQEPHVPSISCNP